MNNDTATTANCMEQSSIYQDMALWTCTFTEGTSDNFAEGCYRNMHLDSLLFVAFVDGFYYISQDTMPANKC